MKSQIAISSWGTGGDGRLELLDFKTSPKPTDSPELLMGYERQLNTYVHILESRHKKRPDRLFIYWTSESHKQEALVPIPFQPEMVKEAGRYFDELVAKIQARDFRVQPGPLQRFVKSAILNIGSISCLV